MTINIYLNLQEKMKLRAISTKNEVSTSTIAENVLFYFTKYLLNQENGKEIIQKFGNEYIYMEKGGKTSIKPRVDPTNNGLYKNITKAYTNVLKIWLKKDVKNWINKEYVEKFYTDLNRTLQQTKEPNWDYNRFIRCMKRYERKRI